MDFYLAGKGILTVLRSRLMPASERGASAVEYGIVASLICAAVVVSVFFLGNATNNNFVCTKASITANANQC
jgi:Flp pilus assembly pilin Flp